MQSWGGGAVCDWNTDARGKAWPALQSVLSGASVGGRDRGEMSDRERQEGRGGGEGEEREPIHCAS